MTDFFLLLNFFHVSNKNSQISTDLIKAESQLLIQIFFHMFYIKVLHKFVTLEKKTSS